MNLISILKGKTAGPLGALLLALVFCSGICRATTQVGGPINANTTWTVAAGPYIVTADVLVPRGVTLTIEPGVDVEFDAVDSAKTWTRAAVIAVQGRLQVGPDLATDPDPLGAELVTFDFHGQGGIGDWGGIWIDAYHGGSASIVRARINRAQRAVFLAGDGADTTLAYNVISADLYGLYLEDTSNAAAIHDNSLSGNDYGIFADTASAKVEWNTFTSNSWGIYDFNDQGMELVHNDIKANTYGIVSDGGQGALIHKNDFSIRGNNYGVLIRSGSPVITENNFLYDKDYVQNTPGAVFWYVRNEGSQDISAPGNWWDGTDSAFIDTYIFDKKDDARVGTVYYEPPADQAVSDTADALRPPVVSIQAIPGFSPNGDGSFDRTTITYSLSETAASLSVAISGNGHTYNASFTDAAHVFDGTHSITWDGADNSGVTMPEGVYDVTFTAVDIETGETTTAKGQVLIDLTPPVVSITSPSSPSTVRLALIRVEGTVSDLSPVGLFVKIGNTGATFGASTGNSIPFSGQARLDTGLNQVGVYAADGAGNAALTVLDLTYDPPLTVDNLGVTNQQDAAVTGKLLDTAIDHVDVQLTGDDGTTATEAATLNWNGGNSTYTTPPFTLTRGHALIVASAYDASNTLLGTAVGDITYDPFYNQTLTHHFATGLQMIGVPLMYTLAGDHKAALGLTGGTLDLARWENINDTWGYQYYGTGANANLDQFAAGKGYWLLVDPAQYPGGLDVSANGEGVDPAKPVSIYLRAGWNQISDPYSTAIDWHATQVALSGGKAVSFDQAVQNGWLSAVLWRYDQGGYRLVSTTLEPWQGYWIDVMQDCTLTFAPPNGAGSTQARLGAQRARLSTAGAAPPSPFALGRARSPLAAGLFDDAGPRGPAASWSNTLAVGASPWTASAATGGGGAWARVPQGGGGQAAQAATIRTTGWRLPLQLQADGVDGKGADVTRRDLDNAAGVDAQAKDGFDPSLDYPKPPEMGSYVRGSFELPGAGGAFATDVRAPEAADAGCSDCSGWVWRFDVSTDLKNARLRLAWPGADQLPDDVQLRITDVASGRTIDPRTQASYAFTQPAERPRQFVVQAWSNDGGTLSSALAYPNPADLSGPIHIAFTLGGQAQVDAGVYDATGRRIRHLSAAVLPGGAQELLWDGRDDSGRTVANGLYFVRLSTPVASRTLRVVVLR